MCLPLLNLLLTSTATSTATSIATAIMGHGDGETLHPLLVILIIRRLEDVRLLAGEDFKSLRDGSSARVAERPHGLHLTEELDGWATTITSITSTSSALASVLEKRRG